ncbi:MAG: S9 family peptidase [Proteobacteria bacterium]|nr:S9 family peptidase [Pseudomonadota bacterium]
MIRRIALQAGFALAAVACCAAAAPPAATAAAAEAKVAPAAQVPSVEDFFRKPSYGRPELSPDAKSLAVIAPVGDHLGVGVIDLDSKKVMTMKAPADADAIRVAWINDKRLVITIGDLNRATGDPPTARGYVVVDRDGSDQRILGGYNAPTVNLTASGGFKRPWSVSLVRPIEGTSDVLVTALDRDVKSLDLYRYDTETGRAKLLSFESPGYVTRWVADFDNVPRAAVSEDVDDDKAAWYVRKSAGSPWIRMEEAHVGDLKSGPMQFDASGKILYVWARKNGDDRASIYEYTVDTGAWKEVVSHPVRDIDEDTAFFIDDYADRKVLGLYYTDDRPTVAWFDPEYARVQKSVDAALPGMVNYLHRRKDRWIVTSFSDRNPGEAYMLDGKTMKMEKLFSYEPQIDPKAMAPIKWVRYQARDGLTIPALLTVPNSAGGKPVPLVVDIHGGPNVEANEWGYNPEAQFFASRGYAVLQPQFRGTEGFGWKLESSGFRHWGDTMQDDLADGVKWAVAQGIADPARVCFYGASYGGYASAWGSIANADLIKCAVVYVGVTSIDLLFDYAKTDLSRFAEKDQLMVERIGDPKTERARFKSVNPVDHADRVGVPLLLAYGASDRRVPLIHGTTFRDALDKYHKPYEWVVYANEGHGFTKDKDAFDFYGRVERFLAKYLGGISTSGKPEGATAH